MKHGSNTDFRRERVFIPICVSSVFDPWLKTLRKLQFLQRRFDFCFRFADGSLGQRPILRVLDRRAGFYARQRAKRFDLNHVTARVAFRVATEVRVMAFWIKPESFYKNHSVARVSGPAERV